MMIRIAVLLAAAAFESACGGTPERSEPRPIQVEASSTGGAPGRRQAAAAPRRGNAATEDEALAAAAALREAPRSNLDYRIAWADLVSVTVYGVPEMSRRVRVNASGVVFLPLVGAVYVGGKSLGTAQSLIEKKLAAYVVKPQVTLFIEEYGNRTISVMGEVQRPGSYPLPAESGMTILEAISTAGGFTPVAAQDRARLLRTVNGESMKYTIDVRDLTRGESKEKDIVLQPNDVIFVPQSLF